MDGRVQEPVIAWIRKQYAVQYVDSVTEPGPIRILADGIKPAAADSIRRRVDISVNSHGSRAIAVVAHYDCTGNPASREEQMRQLAVSVDIVQGWGYQVPVQGLWVDENWQVQAVPQE